MNTSYSVTFISYELHRILWQKFWGGRISMFSPSINDMKREYTDRIVEKCQDL